MKTSYYTKLASLALFGLVLPPGAGISQQNAAASGAVKAQDEALTSQSFTQQAAAAGFKEVRLGELAAKNAENKDVRAFAQMMVDDHKEANAELTKLATQKGLQLPVQDPAGDLAAADTYRNLQALTGTEFDQAYMREMARDHHAALSLFERACQNLTDPDLKQFAANTLPTLREHQEHAGKISAANQWTVVAPTNAADNTGLNTRDGDGKTWTPFDQGNSKEDVEKTAQIRKAIMAADAFSFNAKNVKIITNNGKVALRGPVDSAEEKHQINDIAERVAGADNVANQIDVNGTEE